MRKPLKHDSSTTELKVHHLEGPMRFWNSMRLGWASYRHTHYLGPSQLPDNARLVKQVLQQPLETALPVQRPHGIR